MIGTQWSIETDHPLDNIKSELEATIEEFDRTYSRFRDDSLVTEISRSAGEYEFPNNAQKLVTFYRDLYEATDGAVSPLVGDVLSTAGYDKEYSFVEKKVREAPVWDDAMKWDANKLQSSQPMLLDFGAAGKGYLVDLLSEILEARGIAKYVIDASGDVRIRGQTEVIGLENPYDATSILGTAIVSDASLCASATNRRAWGRWNHVIDPRTATPVRDVVATWVVAATTFEADGLATALFFVPASKLGQWDFHYVRLLASGRIEHSDDFVGELYT